MSKPSTYLYALIAGVSLGWLAQQFWSVGQEQSNRARDSLLSQNEARIQRLKSEVRYSLRPEVNEVQASETDQLVDLLANNQLDEAAQLYRERWGDFSQDLAISRILTKKWIDVGNYDAALTLLYDQRLFVSFEQETELLQLIYESVVSIEMNLSQPPQLKRLVSLYNLLISLHADHPPYYLRLTHWLIESGDFYAAELSLLGAMNDIQYQDDVATLLARIESNEAGFDVIAVPISKVGEHFVVEVLVDEVFTLSLMIDTGATMSVFKTSLVESNLAEALIDAEPLTMNTANGKVAGKRLKLESFAFGQHVLNNVEVGVVALPGFKFDGLLGMNVLNRFDFFIDQERQVLVLK